MTIYEENFEKYYKVTGNYENYEQLVHEVEKKVLPCPENPSSNSILVVGYSGNGKTTWIEKFLSKNPDYKLISIDHIAKRLYKKFNRGVTNREIIKALGLEIDMMCSNNEKIVIDGSFLNLLTRCIISDTLKQYNYQVNIVDITNIINTTLSKRIMDITSSRLNVTINSDNVSDYLHNSVFISTRNEIMKFFYREKNESRYEEQSMLGVVSLGVNKVFDENSDYADITRLSSSQK